MASHSHLAVPFALASLFISAAIAQTRQPAPPNEFNSQFVLVAQASRVGRPAPQFTATDSNDQSHWLSRYRGQYVVRASTISPGTCRTFSMSGPQREWSGSPTRYPRPCPTRRSPFLTRVPTVAR